jgi:cytochrome bd-type quinol oxidase subunit 2
MIYLLFALSAIIFESVRHFQKEVLMQQYVLMEPLWIAISIIALVVIVVLLLIARRRQYQQPSNLAIVGICLVVLGIIFGDDRLVGYSLIGVGVLLSVIEAIRNRR